MSLKNLVSAKKITQLTTTEAKELQALLNGSGFGLVVDGIVGEATITAFNQYKSQNRLEYPDLIGKTTIAHLVANFKKQQPSNSKVNAFGLKLIKEFEGFRSSAYICPAGVATIGYGSTFYPDGSRVKIGDKITTAEGEALLLTTLKSFETAVRDRVKVELNSNEFSALVSFAFNVGVSAFFKSTLLELLNKGDRVGASAQFDKWTRGGGQVLPGLVRRRKAEKNLFLAR